MFVGPFSDGATQEAGVALMQNINDTVIVNVFSTFSNFIAARRTCGDLFGYLLITLWAKFHKLFSECWRLQTIGPARPMGRGGLKRLEEILHSISGMVLITGSVIFDDSLQAEEQNQSRGRKILIYASLYLYK
jgi:hypothetical protein